MKLLAGGTIFGIIYFVFLFIYTHKMINSYGTKLREQLKFSESDDKAIDMVTKFGDGSNYRNGGGPEFTDTDKAVKLLEEIEGKLELYFGLYIAGSIIFFGFLFISAFILPFYFGKNPKTGKYTTGGTFFGIVIAICLLIMIIFAIIYMKNIKKGMDNIPSFIDNEIKRNNNTSS